MYCCYKTSELWAPNYPKEDLLGYADNINANSRPNCWGNDRSYNLNDPECAECRFKHSCRSEINKGDYSTPSRRTTRHRDDDSADMAEYNSGIVGENEKPIERFAKDCVAGGLRGVFHEAWQFWKRYRIR